MAEQLETTHTIIERELVVYRRERSSVWQCRFKVDGEWQRASTKESNLSAAKTSAKKLLIEAEIRKRSNLPVVSRKFRDIAKLAIQRMENELANNVGKVVYTHYIAYIKNYLIPAIGKHHVDRIDAAAIDAIELHRMKQTGRPIAQSTKLTQNAALNRIFDEAELRGFLTPVNRPKLDVKGQKGERRAVFSLEEIRAFRSNFEPWITRGRNDLSRELRALMRDYCELLLDTGARPGVEFMNLKWNQIKFSISPVVVSSAIDPETGEPVERVDTRPIVEITVSGKTGRRTIIGTQNTVEALVRIAKRNYPDAGFPILNKLQNVAVAKNDDFVLRLKDKSGPTSFPKLLRSYLLEHDLLDDPITGQERVFYSLRHTYATLALTHDRIAIHTLAKQMGTSVLMIEKHYSHLRVVQAIDQLRREETRQLIEASDRV